MKKKLSKLILIISILFILHPFGDVSICSVGIDMFEFTLRIGDDTDEEIKITRCIDIIKQRFIELNFKDYSIRKKNKHIYTISLINPTDYVLSSISQRGLVEFKKVENCVKVNSKINSDSAERTYRDRKHNLTSFIHNDLRFTYICYNTEFDFSLTQIIDVTIVKDKFGKHDINIELSDFDFSNMIKLSTQSINQRIALLFDGICMQAPIIQDQHPSKIYKVVGFQNLGEAQYFKSILKFGVLPLRIQIEPNIIPNIF